MRQVQQIEREFENDPATDTRPFYFACGATTLIYKLRRLPPVTQQFPKITMQVMVAPTEEMVAGVLDRRFDLALVTLPFPTGELGVTPLFEEELVILRPSVKRLQGWHVGAIESVESGGGSVPAVSEAQQYARDYRSILPGDWDSAKGDYGSGRYGGHQGAGRIRIWILDSSRVCAAHGNEVFSGFPRVRGRGRGGRRWFTRRRNPRALTMAIVKFLLGALGNAAAPFEIGKATSSQEG